MLLTKVFLSKFLLKTIVLQSFVKIFKDNIVFFTFFDSHEFELFKRVHNIYVIRSKFSAKPFSKDAFFYAALTMLNNISIARTLWWLDLLPSFLEESTFSSYKLNSLSASFEILSSFYCFCLILGKIYLKRGFSKLLPRLESHSSKIL